MQLVDHMEGSHTTIRQRCLYPHTAHTWDRSLHHDGVAKLDTVHSGGRIEASKIISVVSEDALELLHKPRVTTENLRVRICPRLEAPVLSQLLHYRDHPMASTANCCNIQNVCSSSKTIYRDDSQLPRSHDNACVNIPAALLTGTKQVRRTMEFLG